jgi:uncharacterized protein YdeI (YjbR/CyaY-like superfamily)
LAAGQLLKQPGRLQSEIQRGLEKHTTAQLRTLQVRSRRQWRAWLEKHHTSSPGVWLVFYKAHTGVKSIRYEDTVREALCFGWIDSLIKRLDDDRYLLKITPPVYSQPKRS